MEDYEETVVSEILNEWNPLGDEAEKVKDLNGYKTEAEDILFHLEMSGTKTKADVKKTVMQVLNQAFDLDLTDAECSDAADKIVSFLWKKH
jgi:hypothetical protein